MDAKICDVCQKQKADFICAICGKDLCKSTKCREFIRINLETDNPRSVGQSYDIYRMCFFNFCKNCKSKVPWKSKDPMDESTHQMILEQLKKRILAEAIVKGAEGK